MEPILGASIGAAVAAFLGSIGTLSGAAAGTTAAVFQGIITVASFAYSIVSGVQAYRAGKKQQEKAEDLREAQRDAVSNYRDPIEPHRIVYGQTRLGGPIIYAEESGGGPTLHLLIALAAHEVEEIGDFYVNDELVTFTGGVADGKFAHIVYAKKYLGLTAQGIKAEMEIDGPIYTTGVDNLIATDAWDGIACLYIRLWRWAKKFQESPNFSAVVKGRKVYDPRTGLTEWSDNPALCAADYLVNFMGFDYSRLNEADLIASANTCDEDVSLKAGGTEKRYTCNGVVIATQTHESVLGMFQDAMAGRIVNASGTWRILAGAPILANEGTFTENDLAGAYRYKYNVTDRELPNIVRGHFLDPTQEGEPVAYPARKDATWSAGSEIAVTLDLPLTNSHTMAQRIAEIALRKARLEKSIEAPVRPRWLTAVPGDVVMFSGESVGEGAELWEVLDLSTRISVGEGGAVQWDSNVFLSAYSDLVYDWDETTDELDLDTATTNLGGVSATFPTNGDVTETINSTAPTLDVEYLFTWTDPPSQATKDLVRVEARVTITINTNVGTEEDVLTGEVLPGVETITLSDDYAYGNTYVDHEYVAELRACYDDGTCSEWIQVT